jgi:dienelactone hydrolase
VGALSIFQPDPHEPISLCLREAERPAESREVRQLDFELSSLGDRVPGRLLLPASRPGPYPLIFAQHGAGGAKDAGYMDTACLPWVRGGAAVASVDFPLHGKRASPKLSERMLHLFQARSGLSPFEAELWTGFVRQAVVDLRRTIDALAELEEVDARRIAYAGFSLGTILGVPFCAEETRIRAAALAIGGGGIGPQASDPVGHIPRFAPRPVLFVNATRDETFPRESAEALHQAAGNPKEVLWFDCTHSQLPGVALKAMWRFLERHLEIQGGARARAAR